MSTIPPPGNGQSAANAPRPKRDSVWAALPMLKRYPIIAGALAGVLLRLAFSGGGGSRFSAMAGAFIYIAPVVVGMVTVYLAERQRRRTWGYYIGAPFLATSLFVVGTLLILIEGLICAIVIIPMFAVLGAVGGLAMGVVCRLTNWPRPTLYGFATLPLLIAIAGDIVPTPARVAFIERAVTIDAPASTVWQQLNRIEAIHPDEMSDALALRIGVPAPISGTTRQTPDGLVRESRWGKQVHFEEVIRDWQPERYVRWTYRFAPDSFPPYALDDHVVVGGYYFDVKDTSYTLTPVGESTELKISMGYRVTTQFNWYAEPLARYLLGNFEEVVLDFYRARSESLPAHPAVEPTSDGRG